jgi:immune inhibitor A
MNKGIRNLLPSRVDLFIFFFKHTFGQLSVNSSLLIFPLLLTGSMLLADVPHPDLLQKIQSGEIEIPYYLKNIDRLRSEGVNTPAILPNGKPPELPSANTEDNYNAIAILVDFSDNVAQVNPDYFDSLLYGTGTGTVRHYYDEVTYGNLTIVTVNLPSSIGWKRAPQIYTYYTNNNNGLGSYPQNAQKLTEEAIALANPYVDFSQYDNNNDGYVDALFIIHAGPGAELTGDNDHIWSHKWATHSPQLVDGVYAYIYSMEPEFWQNPGDMTCGVYAHEMGHAVFSLPDVYDRDGSSRGLGRWSLMANGSWNGTFGSSPAHPDAWCRSQMGYVTPINIITDTTQYAIPNIQNNQVICRLWTQGQIGNQYFLVENRQRVGYDAALPAGGLLIYHVDEAVSTQNDREWYPGYTSNGHYLVALEQADGLWSMEKNVNSGNHGDPFPGSTNKTSFDSTTTPDSKNYNFNATGVAVHNISSSANIMYADFAVGNPPLFPDIQVTPTYFTFTLQQNDTTSDFLVISNTGNLNLDWSIGELDLFLIEGNGQLLPSIEASWLSESPISGTVAPGNSQNVKLLLDAAGMTAGSYVCSLSVFSNDPNENPLIVPVTLNVNTLPVNQPPVAANDLSSLEEDQSTIINVLANDYDPDGSVNPSTVTIVSNPQHGSFSVNPGDGRVSYQPAANYFGSDQLCYTVQDNQGEVSNIAQVNIEVTAVNDPPSLSNIPDVQFAEDDSYFLPLNPYLNDVDHAVNQISITPEVLSAHHSPARTGGNSLLLDPPDLTINIDPATHEASFSCTADSFGIFTVMFVATDDSGASESDTITVLVNEVNDPPMISGLLDTLLLPADSTVTIQLWDFVNDPETPDPDMLYQFIQYPELLQLNYQNGNGTLQLTSLPGSTGLVLLEITVTDHNGTSDCDTILVVLETITGFADIPISLIPKEYFLDQNYPNPFNPTTTIRFGLPEDSWIRIDIFNLQGQLLCTIEQDQRLAGIQKIVFDAADLASGIYFYRMTVRSLTAQTDGFVQMKKMLLMK